MNSSFLLYLLFQYRQTEQYTKSQSAWTRQHQRLDKTNSRCNEI